LQKDPKIDRKSLKNPDAFVIRGQRAIHQLIEQRTPLIAIAAFGLLVIFGFYGYQWYAAHRAEGSWQRLAEINKAPDAERWDKYKTLFNDVSWSRPKYFAAIALGDHYFDETKKEAIKAGGDINKSSASALEWYNKALDYGELLPKERQLVLVNRGSVYEMAKKYDEALADFQKAADLSQDAKGFALLNVAREFELKGDEAKAVQTYEKIALEFKETEYAKLAKNYLRRLKSPLFKAEPKKS
jgi:tetratricopeptide (TPR) repeat protein